MLKLEGRRKISPDGGDYNIEKFANQLVKIKKFRPNIFRARIYPTGGVKYQSIVNAIDTMKISPENEEFPVKDKDTGKIYNTVVMFDDVTFGNLLDVEKEGS